MNEFVTVIFDAGGGGLTVSSKRVTVGETYGELPTPTRFGYKFLGWYTEETGGDLIDADTAVTASQSHAIYAQWEKNAVDNQKLEAYKKKKATLVRQKTIVMVSVLLVVLAIIGLCVVNYFINRTDLEDVDGTVYKIIYRDKQFVLCDENEDELPMTEDKKFYITEAGSQIRLDASTGVAEIFAYVDTVGKEVLGNVVTSRIMAFPQVERSNIARIEVHNDHGTYAFVGEHKNGNNTFYISGNRGTIYDQEAFASLVVSCGYPLANMKITQPIADENGKYSMYGLVEETRVDAEGNQYTYTPAYFELTDTSGEVYKVIVGDMTVPGDGYYIQYLNPDYPDTPFIYVVNADIADTVLSPVEALVAPIIVDVNVSVNNYYDIRDFMLLRRDNDDIVAFNFIPLEQRTGTLNSSTPYVFLSDELKGFRPSSETIDECLQNLCGMTFVGVSKLNPDDEDMVTFGVASNKANATVYFKFLYTDDNGKTSEIEHYLLISDMTEAGTYYIYTSIHDIIVEANRNYLGFLDLEISDWVDESAYNFNIAGTEKVELKSAAGEKTFYLDNSDSKQFTSRPLSGSTYTSIGYSGEKTAYYLTRGADGKYGIAIGSEQGEQPAVYIEETPYLILEDGEKTNIFFIKDKDTTALDLTKGQTGNCRVYVTEYNKSLDSVMYMYVDVKTGAWGIASRELFSGDIRVTATEDGGKLQKVDTTYFRHFFQTILYASLEGDCTLTEEEMAALRAKPDSEAQLVLTITLEDKTLTYRFYQYSERRSYITVDGVGSFYILSDRVDKIWGDAEKIIDGIDVDPKAKN